MKRSNALLVSNILASIYSAGLLCWFLGAIIKAGGADFLKAMAVYFKASFEVFGFNSAGMNLLYAIIILLWVHIFCFVIGCIIGWISYGAKKSGTAKAAATFYLIGTICFPIFIIIGLPITIVGFVGGSKQKKINNDTLQMQK